VCGLFAALSVHALYFLAVGKNLADQVSLCIFIAGPVIFGAFYLLGSLGEPRQRQPVRKLLRAVLWVPVTAYHAVVVVMVLSVAMISIGVPLVDPVKPVQYEGSFTPR
jgi:hypothetical protein